MDASEKGRRRMMDRKQVIEELMVLIEAFKEERDAYPVCLEEAIRILKEEDK